jgi:hypothetical protein
LRLSDFARIEDAVRSANSSNPLDKSRRVVPMTELHEYCNSVTGARHVIQLSMTRMGITPPEQEKVEEMFMGDILLLTTTALACASFWRPEVVAEKNEGQKDAPPSASAA